MEPLPNVLVGIKDVVGLQKADDPPVRTVVKRRELMAVGWDEPDLNVQPQLLKPIWIARVLSGPVQEEDPKL